MICLAADIGGTYSRLAWFERAFAGPSTEQRYLNAEFGSLDAVIERGLNELGRTDSAVDKMVLALPGPVAKDPVELTNIRWRVSRDALRRRFGVTELTIVNDFQAAAAGTIDPAHACVKTLNHATPDDGPVVVTGTGTGLGMAWLPQRRTDVLPNATEGGHIDFAPSDDAQRALHRWLADRYGHVSYERILSGQGLVDAYRWIAGDAAAADRPATITAMAAESDRAATGAIRLFADVLAAYAGNLALAFNPTGGLYIGGGLSVHLADWLEPSTFVPVFAAKGRMSEVVRRIPVFLVSRHGAGLTGAIRIARAAQGSRKA